jgi:hypothetical protein
MSIPATVFAGTVSSSCYPSVDCDSGQDAYGSPILCRPPINAATDCPGSNPAFSCTQGCYQVVGGGPTPAPSCPTVSWGIITVPALTAINANGLAQFWDCATKDVFSTIAFAPNGQISNTKPNLGVTIADSNGFNIGGDDGVPHLSIAANGDISNPTPAKPVNISDPEGLSFAATGALAQTGVSGRFKGFAVGTYTGLQMGAASPANGYALANAKCTDPKKGFPGSHICSPKEMVFTYSEGTPPPTSSPSAWLNSGATAYVKYVSNDCNGWTSNSDQIFAYTWNFTKKQGFMSSCDQAMRVACCVY